MDPSAVQAAQRSRFPQDIYCQAQGRVLPRAAEDLAMAGVALSHAVAATLVDRRRAGGNRSRLAPVSLRRREHADCGAAAERSRIPQARAGDVKQEVAGVPQRVRQLYSVALARSDGGIAIEYDRSTGCRTS